jgi:hypothetical protein
VDSWRTRVFFFFLFLYLFFALFLWPYCWKVCSPRTMWEENS